MINRPTRQRPILDETVHPAFLPAPTDTLLFHWRVPPPIGLVRRLLLTCDGFYERWRQRRSLEELPEHLLRDIGVGRAEAKAEARKPFWT